MQRIWKSYVHVKELFHEDKNNSSLIVEVDLSLKMSKYSTIGVSTDRKGKRTIDECDLNLNPQTSMTKRTTRFKEIRRVRISWSRSILLVTNNGNITHFSSRMKVIHEIYNKILIWISLDCEWRGAITESELSTNEHWDEKWKYRWQYQEVDEITVLVKKAAFYIKISKRFEVLRTALEFRKW